jgi:hypothetical protein
MSTILLSPEGSSKTRRAELASRTFKTLDGVTVGLLGNSKLNADAVLAAVGELLAERYKLAGIVARSKPIFSQPAPEAIVDELAVVCDVVIAGVGD